MAPGAQDGAVAVAFVDDHVAVCAGVLLLLADRLPEVVPVPPARSVPGFLEQQHDGRRADVVLLDLELRDGTEAAGNVAELRRHGYPVVVYTGEDRPAGLRASLAAGAAALVSKNDGVGPLADAVLAVHRGEEGHFSPLMSRTVLGDARLVPHLSPTHLAVLRLHAGGVPARLIARRLGCRESTVHSHLGEVKRRYAALDRPVSTRTDLLRAGLRDGFIAHDWFREG